MQIKIFLEQGGCLIQLILQLIDGVNIILSAGNFNAGTFTLYGLKN